VSHIDAKGCHVRWMYMHCQKRQYMTPWDENRLFISVNIYHTNLDTFETTSFSLR